MINSSPARKFQKELKGRKENNAMKIDLFLLHDDLLDNNPRKCIVASGTQLKEEINKYINYLISKGWSRRNFNQRPKQLASENGKSLLHPKFFPDT